MRHEEFPRQCSETTTSTRVAVEQSLFATLSDIVKWHGRHWQFHYSMYTPIPKLRRHLSVMRLRTEAYLGHSVYKNLLCPGRIIIRPGQNNNPPGQNTIPPGQNPNPLGQNPNPPGQNPKPPEQNTNSPPGRSSSPPGQNILIHPGLLRNKALEQIEEELAS